MTKLGTKVDVLVPFTFALFWHREKERRERKEIDREKEKKIYRQSERKTEREVKEKWGHR